MELKEFKELKVGDKVKIVKDYDRSFMGCIRDGWNEKGLMDKWLGKVMTIRKLESRSFGSEYARMEEDKNEYLGYGWMWSSNMIEKKIEEETVIVIKTDGTTVTAYRGKEKGIAKCAIEDEFDLYTGASLALDRLFGKEDKKIDIPTEDLMKKEEVKEEPKQPKQFKPGDKVRIVSTRPERDIAFWNSKMDKWLGQVMTIRDLFSDCVYHMEEDRDEWHGCCGEGFLWKKDWIEGKVEEDWKIAAADALKTMGDSAKGATDALDGLTYACRVIDELHSEPEVKEVKRIAKSGEYIKIVNPECTFGLYRKGDIYKVVGNNFKGCLGGDYVYIDRDNGFFKGGKAMVNLNEYVVLEGYEPPKQEEAKPEVKEVKRAAKVGEWIKIIKPIMSESYIEGDILQCVLTHQLGSVTAIPMYDDYERYVYQSEYVVLENYQPEED